MTATKTKPKNQSAISAYQQVRDDADRIKSGEPQVVSNAATEGDAIAQGDFMLVFVDREKFTKAVGTDNFRATAQRQMVEGTSTGSRHVIVNADKVYEFTDNDARRQAAEYLSALSSTTVHPELLSLVIEFERATGPSKMLTHPTHGDFVFETGKHGFPTSLMAVGVHQRAWADEVRRQQD